MVHDDDVGALRLQAGFVIWASAAGLGGAGLHAAVFALGREPGPDDRFPGRQVEFAPFTASPV